jgi:phosphohistidine phosphatase
MDLYIIRHAWAGHYGDPDWPDDSQRPLTPEGKKRFAKVVERLLDRGFAPEVIAASPLVRCRQTAELVAAGVPGRPKLVELDALKPGSNLKALLKWTTAQAKKHEQIAWVGHAPDVSYLTHDLVRGSDDWIRFAKGATAAIRFPGGAPEPGQGELRWLATAKSLGC